MKEGPEFNNGFITALALFYGHRSQWEDLSKKLGNDMRIYPASDHLIDIEYPTNISKELREEIEAFVSDTVKLRFSQFNLKVGNSIFDRCKKILRQIDEEIFGLKVTIKHG